LSWIFDLAELGETVDWAVVNERARGLRIQRLVAIHIALVKRLFGSGIADTEDNHARVIAGELEGLIRSGREIDVTSMAYFRLMVRGRERWRDRVRFLVRLAFTPGVADWKAVSFPEKMFPMYRIARMYRLGRRIGNELRGGRSTRGTAA
jgi:hypothetical protein